LAGSQVPAGIYADHSLESLSLLEPLSRAGKVVRAKDVRLALNYVELGEAEAGLVYATDAKISQRVEVVEEMPPDSYPSIVYPLVILQTSSRPKAAQSFLAFLQSEKAAEIFRRWGFSLLSDSP
jgi:molybdate transport system substrate-binding protein